MNILDLDLLTPGSVWHNTKTQKVSRVVCITNTSLSPKLQDAHPQQVVYLDENGNFLSVDVEAFLGKRSFFNVDPALETAATNLATFYNDGASDEDVENLLNGTTGESDLLVVEDDADTDADSDEHTELMSEAEADGADSEESEDSDSENEAVVWAVHYVPADSTLPTAIDPQVLQALTLSYDQTPLMESDRLMHSIVIAQDPRFTREELAACFVPQDDKTVFMLRVEGNESIIDWDTYVDIFPVVVDMEPAFKVVLLNSLTSEEALESAAFDLGGGIQLGGESATNTAPVAQADIKSVNVVPAVQVQVAPAISTVNVTTAVAVAPSNSLSVSA